jgi:hypothetical protein
MLPETLNRCCGILVTDKQNSYYARKEKGERKMQLWNIEPPKKVIFACLMAIFLMTMIPLPARAAVHNLAIVSVEPALSLVAPGGSVNVTATIENLGTVPMNATTQLQFFYRDYESGTEGTGDDTPWGTWFAQVGYVAILNAGENASYTVTWDVPAWLTPGDYQIRAGFPYAWVDDDPSDNTLLSDKVTVEPPPPPPPVGGKAAPIIIAMTNLGLLAPLIGLAALITLVAVSIIYVKHKKKKQT